MSLLLDLTNNRRYVIIGSSGTGKSNLAYFLIEKLAQGKFPFAIIDHAGEYLDLPGVTVCNPDRITGLDLAKRLKTSNVSVTIDMRRLAKGHQWVYDFLIGCLKTKRKIPLLIVIEEAHNYSPQSGQPISKKAVERLLGEGRKHGYGACLITHRPAKISKDSIAETEIRYFLGHYWEKDQKYLKEMFGDQKAYEIATLENYYLMIHERGDNKFHPKEKIPFATNKRAGKTPKAQAVNPDYQALTRPAPVKTKPWTHVKNYVTEEENKDFSAYWIIGLALAIIAVLIGLWAYKSIEKERRGSTEVYHDTGQINYYEDREEVYHAR